jgi:hypothetical protein
MFKLTLHNCQQAQAEITAKLFPWLRRSLQASKRLVLTVQDPPRSKGQNSRYWGDGVLAQVAQQACANGRMYSAEVWHEYFKRMFIGVYELPDGSLAGKSSTELTTRQFATFCTQVEAYAISELGVIFYELRANPYGLALQSQAH